MPPAPKPASQRRNRGTPKSWGESDPVSVSGEATEAQPDLGFDAVELILGLWDSLGDSPESKFFSAADWQRARLELWFANKVVSGEEPVTASKWATIQDGLSALLISPADKRRAGIELKRAVVDPAAEAADAKVADLAERLRAV
jgi:hypothetical protein